MSIHLDPSYPRQLPMNMTIARNGNLRYAAAMLACWPDIVRPLLDRADAKHIVEIGSESGKTTRLLLDRARSHGGTVCAIDPAPGYDVDAVLKAYDGHFKFHRLPSLVALSAVEQFDAVLIDGDHNWYTVYHELELIERRAADTRQLMPVIILHDVGWPYGRRDLYYAPDAIPQEYRQAWARKGISPTSANLLEQGGYNAKLCNAIREGGPRNGVLTAVEDYLASTRQKFLFARIPAVFGLALLLPEIRAASTPEAGAFVKAWMVPEVERFIERMELARIAMMTGC